MSYVPFERKLERIAAAAIESSQQEIALAFDIKFGSPIDRLIGELGTYARHLAYYTCDNEEIGNVRPLRDLLADAALTISIQAKLGAAALAAGAQRAETNEDLAQSEGRQSGDTKQRNAQPLSDRIEQFNQGGSK